MSARVFRTVATIVSVVVLAAFVSRSGARETITTQAKEPDDVTKSMRQLLSDTLNENRLLKRRVKELKAEVQELRKLRTRTVVPPQPGVPAQPLPPGWKKVPYGSGHYYLVPLEESKPATGTAARTPPPAPRPTEKPSR